MMPTDATHMNLLGFLFILTVCTLILVLPRRLAFIPIILTACYMTYGQQAAIFGFNFTALRFVILAGWIRLIVRGEIRTLCVNSIDKAFIWWIVIGTIAYVLLWQTSQAFIYRLGLTYNAAGLYFLFRVLIRDVSEIKNVIKISSVIIFPLSMFILLEMFTGRNIFSVFGGVDAISWVRNGWVRAQGPFRYCGLAGTVGAVLMPLYVSLWFDERSRFYSIVGMTAATIIMVGSHSSGPILAYLFGIFGMMLWILRNRMRAIRYSIAFTVISLHMVMKAPVWYLIARLSELVGGNAWHRAEIINAAVKYFDEWWLLGTKNTADWMPYAIHRPDGQTYADITNQFIAEGVKGGLAGMLSFIIIIALCFREVGLSLMRNEDRPFSTKIMLWSLGSSLFAHTTNFFSVSYFDQTIVFWHLTIASIAALSMQRLYHETKNGITVETNNHKRFKNH